MQTSLGIRRDVPEPAIVPVRGVFPLETIDDGIQADAFEWHPGFDRDDDLISQFADPRCASRSDVAGLSDEKRTPVPIVDLVKERMKRHPAPIARVDVPGKFAPTGMFPLIVVIEVHAHDVEVPRLATKLRAECA